MPPSSHVNSQATVAVARLRNAVQASNPTFNSVVCRAVFNEHSNTISIIRLRREGLFLALLGAFLLCFGADACCYGRAAPVDIVASLRVRMYVYDETRLAEQLPYLLGTLRRLP